MMLMTTGDDRITRKENCKFNWQFLTNKKTKNCSQHWNQPELRCFHFYWWIFLFSISSNMIMIELNIFSTILTATTILLKNFLWNKNRKEKKNFWKQKMRTWTSLIDRTIIIIIITRSQETITKRKKKKWIWQIHSHLSVCVCVIIIISIVSWRYGEAKTINEEIYDCCHL